jgi:hypothetical protein
MIAFIQHNLISVGITAGIAMGLGVAIKALPKLLEAKVQAALEFLFNSGDAADKAWFIATCVWAEQKYGPGSGAVKAQVVVNKILGLLPLRYRYFISDASKAKAIELFQKSFDAIEAEVKAVAQKNG